jgi:UDP-N-acetylglucosamine 4,6-dehydratase
MAFGMTADTRRANMKDKTILITGSTGSLGTALCLRLKQDPPNKVVALYRGWDRKDALAEKLGDAPYMRYRMGDVRDYARLCEAFEDVDYIIHTAAIKSIVDAENESEEVMKTNVEGTQNVINAAIHARVKKVMFISTDKAVNPINTYGMSKAMGERLILSANKRVGDKDIKFSVVRYGNVVGSAGSVVPRWAEMIRNGCEYLPITDRNMTRFWFPMQEAVSYVLLCLEDMQGGETFIPRIPSVWMTDVALAFKKEWREIGIRPCEKLHEELGDGYNSHVNRFLSNDQIRETIKEWL